MTAPLPLPVAAPRRARWRQRARLWSLLYLLMAPTTVGLLLFTWWPNADAIRYAFHRWDGSQVEEFIGLGNFVHAVRADSLFWPTFGLVGILLAANLLKMWPSILVAIAIHRLRSTRWQYLYRVLFVIPMVIPGLVFLLVWKTFFTEGLFNQVLQATGLMAVLAWLDSPSHGLPALAALVDGSAYAWNADRPLLSALLQPLRLVPLLFGSAWGLLLFTVALLGANVPRERLVQRWPLGLALIGLGVALWGPWRIVPLLAAAIALPLRLRRRDPIEGPVRARRTAWIAGGIAASLILLTTIWTVPTGAFATGDPSWLGNSRLVIPAVLIWGFPWVGTVGVLIYLAGLQNIPTEVYEAAELDGVGRWGRVLRIEVPLIMTQVRINLIFLTIGTLTDYAFFLILLGPNGGPDNAGMVPGLYMYQKAFIHGEFGYACALGMILFVIVLALTMVYQRFVRVEK